MQRYLVKMRAHSPSPEVPGNLIHVFGTGFTLKIEAEIPILLKSRQKTPGQQQNSDNFDMIMRIKVPFP